ncbi:AAA family ATPase [Bacillus mobilis]|uniref:AAA family ATPase n=1 Tax=Bacillus mobilis TaxID=2026190 RepID=UPI0013D8C096|nr:AAA family ATPase [Bacillus mobilis]NEL00405.1 AAA family ATPase [Bacillus mobilis]
MMRIKWIEIKNFRSIKDSGKFFLNSNISILAGKNESGKSNVLKALKAFGENKFREEDISQHLDNTETSAIKIAFLVTKEELNNIEEIQILGKENYILEVTRDGKTTGFSGELCEKLIVNGTASKLEMYRGEIDDLLEELEEEYEVINLPESTNEEYIEYISALLWDEVGEEYILENPDNEGKVSLLKKYYNAFKETFEYEVEILDYFESILPTFVLFNSFEDMLPEHVTEDEIEESKIVNRFFKLTAHDPKNLFEEEHGLKRRKITDKISTLVSGDFQEFYTQDKVKIEVHLDGEKIHFIVYDENELTPFSPKQRSQGFQWFLSFFLTLNAESRENSIILIDEPGLYLHAKAQEDVLRVLEKLSNHHQIVMTTHSPYFIDPNRLERVSLVLKNKDSCTFVENKIHKGKDQESLTPIITSIGLDLTKSLTFSKNFNLLVEGISDYYYLQAVNKYLEKFTDIAEFNIIPCRGASTIPNVASLLIGWGLNFTTVVDYDNEGKKTIKQLEKLGLNEGSFIFVSKNRDEAIEDLFSKDDFKSYVCTDANQKYSNSRNASEFNKVLLARDFNQRVMNNENIILSEETLCRFQELYKALNLIKEEVFIVS